MPGLKTSQQFVRRSQLACPAIPSQKAQISGLNRRNGEVGLDPLPDPETQIPKNPNTLVILTLTGAALLALALLVLGKNNRLIEQQNQNLRTALNKTKWDVNYLPEPRSISGPADQGSKTTGKDPKQKEQRSKNEKESAAQAEPKDPTCNKPLLDKKTTRCRLQQQANRKTAEKPRRTCFLLDPRTNSPSPLSPQPRDAPDIGSKSRGPK